MAVKNLSLFFPCLEDFHLDKDPFLVPYYLGLMLDCKVTILTLRRECNKDLNSFHRGVNILFFDGKESGKEAPFDYSNILRYVSENAQRIDVLMLFFWDDTTKLFSKTYKSANSSGKVYVKMDVNPFNIKDWPGFDKIPFIKRKAIWCLRLFHQMQNIKNIDIISCETTSAYNKIKECWIPEFQFGGKLVLIPNGLDEGQILKMGIGKKSFNQKENIMLTVGRLGTPPKNTAMILRALEKVNLKNWKFFLVGSIEKDLELLISQIETNHPDLAERLIRTGPINDRKELFELYNKSKVFVLSSLWESYGFVLIEAQRFGNYIVSTPVGAGNDVVNEGKYGELIPLNDPDSLVNAMQNIIDGKTNIDVYKNFDVSQLSWERRLIKVVERLKK